MPITHIFDGLKVQSGGLASGMVLSDLMRPYIEAQSEKRKTKHVSTLAGRAGMNPSDVVRMLQNMHDRGEIYLVGEVNTGSSLVIHRIVFEIHCTQTSLDLCDTEGEFEESFDEDDDEDDQTLIDFDRVVDGQGDNRPEDEQLDATATKPRKGRAKEVDVAGSEL